MEQVDEICVVIGCGGLLFHSQRGMACEARMRGATEYGVTVFMDRDRVKEENMERQAWGNPGMLRSDAAMLLWRELGLMCVSEPVYTRDVEAITEERIRGRLREVQEQEGLDRVIVMALSNNEAQRVAFQVAVMVGQEWSDTEVWFVTAGNSKKNGQAWGYKMRKGAWLSPEWVMERSELWKQELREGEGSCGANQDQSLEGNMATGACVVDVLRALRLGATRAERCWRREKGTVRIWWGQLATELSSATGDLSQVAAILGEGEGET